MNACIDVNASHQCTLLIIKERTLELRCRKEYIQQIKDTCKRRYSYIGEAGDSKAMAAPISETCHACHKSA